MVLKKGMPDLKGIKEKAADMGAATKAKIDETLEEFKKAINLFGKFGFKVGKFKVSMGPHLLVSIEVSLEVRLNLLIILPKHKEINYIQNVLTL